MIGTLGRIKRWEQDDVNGQFREFHLDNSRSWAGPFSIGLIYHMGQTVYFTETSMGPTPDSPRIFRDHSKFIYLYFILKFSLKIKVNIKNK